MKKTKSKKEVVVEDWIERDDDFVFRGGLRSGWDDDYESVSSYVLDGFIKPSNTEAEIREVFTLCKNRCSILAGETPIVFTLNPKESTAKTDGKKVTVGTDVLDTEKSFEEKAEIMVGLTTHEMGHILHSSFTHLKKVKNQFHASILNIIEDERIERLLCTDFPGYASNISSTKKYFFDEKYLVSDYIEEMPHTKGEFELVSAEIYDLMFKMIRYPKYVNTDIFKKHEETMKTIQKILTPYPMTSAKTFKASKAIYDILHKKMLELYDEKSSSPSKDSKSERREETPLDDSSTKEKSLEATSSKETSESDSEKSEESKSSSTEPSSEKEKSSDDTLADSFKEYAVDTMEAKIGEMMHDFNPDNFSSKEVSVSKSVKDIDFTEEFIYDSDQKATFRVGKSDPYNYAVMYDLVKQDSRRLSDNLFTRIFSEEQNLRGMRNGNLDESKIVEAAHGVHNVYFSKTPKQSKKINVVMLIDESGSMQHADSGEAPRYVHAGCAAIMLEKAFESFNVGHLFIYGFTGNSSWGVRKEFDYNQILIYKEPGRNIPYGLGSIRPRFENRDGQCIRAVAKRVRSFTNEPMIFFVISDGMPAAPDYKGTEDTRKAVLEISKKKFFPIQIGIGRGLSPEYQSKMFDDFIHYSNPKDMVHDLRKLVVRKSNKIFGI